MRGVIMTDNELIQLFLPVIKDGLIAAGFSGVDVVASSQPTQQGVNTAPTVFFYKIGDYRYGSVGRKEELKLDESEFVHREIQWYETTFQIHALSIQDVNDITKPTASDLVNTVAAILQSSKTLEIFLAADVGILKIGDIRNPYFSDDRDRFEASPSFDFVLLHQQIIESVTPVVEDVTFEVYEI